MLVKLTKTREKQLRRERDEQQRRSNPGYLPHDVKRAKQGLELMRRRLRAGTLEKTPENAARAKDLSKTIKGFGHTVPEWVHPFCKEARQ